MTNINVDLLVFARRAYCQRLSAIIFEVPNSPFTSSMQVSPSLESGDVSQLLRCNCGTITPQPSQKRRADTSKDLYTANPIATQPSPPITDSSPKVPWLHSPSRQGTDSRPGPD